MEARTATGDLSCAADTGPVYIPGATQQQRDAPSSSIPLSFLPSPFPAQPLYPVPLSCVMNTSTGFSIAMRFRSGVRPRASLLKSARYEISIVIGMKCRSDKRSKEERYTSHHFDRDKLSNLCILCVSEILMVRDVVIFFVTAY